MSSSRRIEVEIIGDPRSVEAAFGRAATASQRFQKGLAPVARGAKIALAGVAGLGIASVKLANDFNRTSSQMVGLAGVGAKQVEQWKSAILDLAPVVGQVPDELAQSLYFIASSGVPAAKALDTLKISAMAATAGLGETQVVADAVTSAMNAYAKENLTAAQAADVLTATVREGKGEASAIAPVLGNILPIASQLGVGFNEVGAAMASMTRLGFDAATAATNLSGVFNALLKPAADSKDALKEIGTSATEVQDMLGEKGLLPTLQFLSDAFDGNAMAMSRVFRDVRGFRAVLALVGKAGDDTAAVFDRMENNTGALDHAFKAVDQDSLAIQQSWAALQAAAIRIGAVAAPAVADLANATADAATFASQHEQAVKAAAIAIAGFSTAIIAANTSLRIYNSELVKVLSLQSSLRGLMVAGGWAAAIAGIALVVHEGLNVLHDKLNEEPAIFGEAEAAAKDYRQALTDLNSTATGYEDAQSRSAHANLNVKATANAAREAVKEFGRGSLEARQAILNHKDAVREAARAEEALTKAHRDNIDAQQRTRIGVLRTTNAIEGLRRNFAGATKGIDRTNEANQTLLRQMDANAVAGFSARIRKLAEENGGLKTEAGRAATTVADLTDKLGRIPTRTEIRLVTNADHTRDQIEAVRAAVERVPTVHTITFNIQTHGSINSPTGLSERQHGGPVVAGRPYVVGERRPELFVPNVSGTILPHAPRIGPTGGGNQFTLVFPNYLGNRGELGREIRFELEKIARRGSFVGGGRAG